jgi:hypothetical protein
MSRPARPGHMAIAKLMARLCAGPATITDLAQASALHYITVCTIMIQMVRWDAAHLLDDLAPDSRGRLQLKQYSIGRAPG